MSTTVSATTDRISLIGLSARGHHGVLPFEREEGQLFTVDVVLDLGQRGTAVAAVTDSVTDAVDYSRVANGIVSIIEGEPVNLIESLADRIAERVLSFPRVVAAEVTVHKPEAPLDVAFEDVSVTIHRVADAAAGHGGAPATSQAAWAAQAEAPVAVSAQPYASPSSSASPVAAASPAAPSYEQPPAAPAAPLVKEVPDVSGTSFAGGDAAPVASTPEPPITPTPSPVSPMEAPARSPFAAAAPSVPTPMPAEPGSVGGGAESTQPWAPDWATESADSSVSSAPSWAPEAPQAPEASSLPSSEAAGSYAASSALDAPSTSAPTAASAGRTAGADGFVSLAADALGAAPAPSEPEPSALSYAEEVAADASAAASSEPAPAAGGLAVQLPREGRHVASSEEGEDQSAPAVEDSADLLNGPAALDESGSYRGAASSQAGDAGDAAPETAGADAPGFPFPPLGADASGPGSAADGFIDASSVPVSQPQGEPGPSPFAGPGEVPGAVSQEAAAPAYSESSYSEPSYSQPSVSEDFSQPAERSLTAPAPAAPEAPAAPTAPVDPLAERPTRPVGVVFGLGANVGGVVDSLRTAVQSLKATEGIEVTQVAPLARTLAVVAEGAEPQPDYLNTVVTAMTTLSPRELLEVCQSLEVAAGRVRTLDVDLIDVEGVTSSDPALTLPHPRAAERAFVLVPWSQADPFAELAGHSVSELAENAPDRGGLRWLAFDWLDSEALPDKPTGPYVEPPVAQDAAGSEPGLVYDATRDESSVADASLSADYAGSISEASSPAPQPAAPAQPLGDQAPAESSPFGQSPFDTSNEASPWAEQAPQIDSPYQAASAPEASGPAGTAGPQDAYTPGQVDGAGGFPSNQQDVGSYANYAGQQGQGAPAAQPQQQDDAVGDAWQSPLQWNDVIGGGSQGTGPRQDV